MSFAVFVAVGVMAVARAAGACPMCLSGTDEGRQAYYATTALLIGGGLAFKAMSDYRRVLSRPSPEYKNFEVDRDIIHQIFEQVRNQGRLSLH